MAKSQDKEAVIDTTASEIVAPAPETQAENVQIPVEEHRVELFIPRGGSNEEPNLLIGINGKNYLLPRGKTSKVPPEVAAEYKRAMRAQEMLDRKIDELRSDNS